MAAILKHVLLLQRNVPAAAAFYEQGLGLIVTQCSDSYAELGDGLDTNGRPVDPKDEKAKPRTVLALKAVGNVSQLTTGYFASAAGFETRPCVSLVDPLSLTSSRGSHAAENAPHESNRAMFSVRLQKARWAKQSRSAGAQRGPAGVTYC